MASPQLGHLVKNAIGEAFNRHTNGGAPPTGLGHKRRATRRRNGTVTVAAALTALLILSPASTRVFATPFGYFIEAPIAALLLFFLLFGGIPESVAAKTVKASVLTFLVLLPFAAIAIMRGVGSSTSTAIFGRSFYWQSSIGC